MLASAVPQIFQESLNYRMRHVALTMPTYETFGHLKVSTSRGQTMHKIEVCSFSSSEDISWGVKF